MDHPDSTCGHALDDPMPARSRPRAWSQQLQKHGGAKRWDGRAEINFHWDNLHRDRDLWFRNGNCFVYLCERDQSRQDPCFKVPLSTLLAAQCHPLVERFMSRDSAAMPDVDDIPISPGSPPLATLDYWARAHSGTRVNLYIPSPTGTDADADSDRATAHHLAVRNLFAWVFRRPLVGEYLGHTLTTLLNTMRQFRSAQSGSDNIQDLCAYLEDEGYLELTGRPDYALAVLQLAEAAQHRGLYIDAFAHCVGMYNHLFLGTEFSHISSISRNLIRRARLDMDMRLGTAGSKLETFLEDDLSETYLGLSTAARAHLDRFRAYIIGFYAARLGYYPPTSVDLRSTIFEPSVYQALADDFQALFNYLVDEQFTIEANSPLLAQGGVCVLQSVESFDERNSYPSLPHPLPLLPEIMPPSSPGNSSPVSPGNGHLGRRLSWLGGKAAGKLAMSRSEKMRPSTRLLGHAALLRASNGHGSGSGSGSGNGRDRSGSSSSRSSSGSSTIGPDASSNELVWAYRRFEEESILAPAKIDRAEKISMVDARKVQWIFIYAVHQTLRNCYLPVPPEVRHPGRVPYHVGISLVNLPPWEEASTRQRPSCHLTRRLTTGSTFASPYAGGDSGMLTLAFARRQSRTNTQNHNGSSARRGSSPVGAVSRAAAVAAAAAALEGMTPEDAVDDTVESPVTFDLLRPDIDYLGLANRREHPENGVVEKMTRSSSSGHLSIAQRSRSLSRSLSRKSAFRRSLALFRSNSTRPQDGFEQGGSGSGSGSVPPMPPKPRRRDTSPGPMRQSRPKIVVHTYTGNNRRSSRMMDPVHVLPEPPVVVGSLPSPTTARTLSTSSTNSATSDASAMTAATAATTASTNSRETKGVTLTESPVEAPSADGLSMLLAAPPHRSLRRKTSSLLGLPPTPSSTPPPPIQEPMTPTRAWSSRLSRLSYRRTSMYPDSGSRAGQSYYEEDKDEETPVTVVARRASASASVNAPPPKLPLDSLLAVRESMESLRVGQSPAAKAAAAAARRGQEVPEWEKFSVGLGGHTVPPPPSLPCGR